MKLTLRKLQRAQPALQKLMNTDLPIQAAFRLSRIAKAVSDIFEDLENQRTALIKKYGKPSGNGEFTVTPSNMPRFSTLFNDLLDKEEISIELSLISEEEILAFENVKLSAMDLLALEPFIISKQKTKKKKTNTEEIS